MPKEKKEGFKSETLAELLKRKREEASEEFELPSGIKCQMEYFSAKKARLCQQIASDGNGIDENMLFGAMIAESCTFNGEKMTADMVIADLPGMDFMTLQGKLSGVSLEPEK